RYGSQRVARAKPQREKIELAVTEVPEWARQPAPPEARPPRPLAPSAIAVDDESAAPPSEAMRAAALRGTWIHQLLERLPQVDRILIDEASVSVIDFKTGRVPASDADIPNAHRAQMNAYVEALRVIFPARRVSASLLYTAGPKLIELIP